MVRERRHTSVAVVTLLGVFGSAAVASSASSVLGRIFGELALGMALVRTFSLLHEAGHRNITRHPRWDDAIGLLAGALCALPYYPWRRVHAFHHRWAGWKDLDPTDPDGDFENIRPAARRVANFAWRWWIPLLTPSLAARTFWNHRRLSRLFPRASDRWAFALSMGFVVCAHALMLWWFKTGYLRVHLPALAVMIFCIEPLAISHHVGLHGHSTFGKDVRPVPVEQQASLARTLTFPDWVTRHVLLGFNLHALHHQKPHVAGHLLQDIDDGGLPKQSWSSWLRSAKRQPFAELLGGQTSRPAVNSPPLSRLPHS